MSVKQRNRTSNWSFCDTNTTWFPSDKNIRCCENAVCQRNTISPLSPSQCQSNVVHGWIRKSILHAVLFDIDKNKQLNVLRTKTGHGDVIYLHPLTMNIMKIVAGKCVVVRWNGRLIIGTCWPGRQNKVDSILLSYSKILSLGAEEGVLVEVSCAPVLSFVADEVTVEVSKCSNFNTTSLAEALCCHLDGCDVVLGEIIQSTFLGGILTFKVVEARTGVDNIMKMEDKFDNRKSVLTDTSRINLNNDFNSPIRHLERDLSTLSLECTPVGNIADSQHSVLETASMGTDSHIYVYHVSYPRTKFIIKQQVENGSAADIPVVQPSKMGGNLPQLRAVLEIVNMTVKFPRVLGLRTNMLSMGILLYGPSGTGKTLLANTVITESNLPAIRIQGPEILSKFYGETESKLRSIFEDAYTKSPCIIFIDELDALCPRRDDMNNETEKRVVSTLLTLMDTLAAKATISPVIVLAATNRIEAVDPALRRPGRFDKEIEVGVPNTVDRGEILKMLLGQTDHILTDDEITDIAETAHGYVGADLAAVVREAFVGVVGRCGGTEGLLSTPNNRVDIVKRDLKVTYCDVKTAFKKVRPSALRSLTVDVPKVKWSDVGGQSKIKEQIREAIEWPLKYPESFKRLGVNPPRGILLYGPPGCSKTMLAKALATESGLNFISVKGPELLSKYLGESEKAIRTLFHKARTSAPCIVFFDELDAIGTRRQDSESSAVEVRVLAQMLTEIDGVEGLDGVTIVAATNRPDLIDSALLRPGRIDRMIYVTLPDEETRAAIFELQFQKMPIAKNVLSKALADMTEGFSGAEICTICKEAAVYALRQNIDASEVSFEHFCEAINDAEPRTSSAQLDLYSNFRLS